MRVIEGLIALLALACLAAEDPAVAQMRIIGEIESGVISAGGGVRQLAKLGDEAYVSSLPALLSVLESRKADQVVADSLLSTLARVNREIPAPLTARVKVWTSGATDGQFLALLEVRQREFAVLRAEVEQTERSKKEAGLQPLTTGTPSSAQGVDPAP